MVKYLSGSPEGVGSNHSQDMTWNPLKRFSITELSVWSGIKILRKLLMIFQFQCNNSYNQTQFCFWPIMRPDIEIDRIKFPVTDDSNKP